MNQMEHRESPSPPDPIVTLRSLLPLSVAVAGASAGSVADALLGAEVDAVLGAIPARRHEFALGRTCARRALQQLGVTPLAIGVGEHREPLWPAGVVGSITHCSSFCAAAVVADGALRGLGIDVEDRQVLPQETTELIMTPGEHATVEPGSEIVLFSAKEAVFKAWWPVTGLWLDFADVDVTLNAQAGEFRADISARVAGSNVTIDGRYALAAGLVLSAVALAH
jgi:4'-phosphopantetheinyl transferase EntD